MSVRRQALILFGIFAVMSVPYFLVARSFTTPEPHGGGQFAEPAPAVPEPVPGLRCHSSSGFGTDGNTSPRHPTPEQALVGMMDEAGLPNVDGWQPFEDTPEGMSFRLIVDGENRGHAFVQRVGEEWVGLNLEICDVALNQQG